MKSNWSLSIIIFLCPLTFLGIKAQSDCYTTFITKGKELEEAGDFGNAIVQYKAAQGCPGLNTEQELALFKTIQLAQNNQITAIQDAQRRAEQKASEATAAALAAYCLFTGWTIDPDRRI